METRTLSTADLTTHLDAFTRLLIDCVNAGAGIGFLAPLSADKARHFWSDQVAPELNRGTLKLLAAFHANQLAGTVQLVFAGAENQPHRCTVAKLMVAPTFRRRGVATQLMTALEAEARAAQRWLITLDTRTGDAGELVYTRLGYARVGMIPDYALNPEDGAPGGTTFFYKRLPSDVD